jgi:two-component system chemotaxis sensor kinase CheA
MDYSDKLLDEFVDEARELIDRIDLGLVRLETQPADGPTLGDVFRAMHTLKGSSGFFALKRVEAISHAAESLLGRLRDGELQLGADSALIGLLLKANDALRAIVTAIEKQRVEPAGNDTDLIAALRSHAARATGAHAAAERAPDAAPFAHESAADRELAGARPGDAPQWTPPADRASPPTPDADALAISPDEGAAASSAPIKVSVQLVNTLMNNVGELVLARNKLLPYAKAYRDKGLSSVIAAIDRRTIDLQEQVLRTRMQPVGQLWTKIPRLVRDVAEQCGKQVTLEMEGAATELDRAMLDVVRDPVMHLVRNCIDHGIEPPEIRAARGKPEAGRLRLNAYHRDSLVVIEIGDDGAGIDFGLVRKRAVERGLIGADQSVRMTDAEALEIIFWPGFSTRDEVTSVSGRGVGMDVVKANIAGIGGSIETDSRTGRYTVFRIRIPLTLAIMTALFVRAGKDDYAFLQVNLLELIRHRLPDAAPLLEHYRDRPLLRIRGELVPLFFLSQHLDGDPPGLAPGQSLNVVVIQTSEGRLGVVVDEIRQFQEVVLKPLERSLRESTLFSSATVMGDGRVCLIIDVDRLAIAGRDLIAPLDLARKGKPADPAPAASSGERLISVLTFAIEGLGETALPLDYVSRLEKIALTEVRTNGDREVVQHGSELIQLIRVGHCLGKARGSTATGTRAMRLDVIITEIDGMTIGLVVDAILRIVKVSDRLHKANPPREGLLGYALLPDQPLNLLDLPALLEMQADPANGVSFAPVTEP